MKIIEILDALAADNSRIAKEQILTKNKDNETLKQIIFLALDPFTQFYIRKIPSYATTDETETLESAIGKLSVLSKREKTGNAAIEHLSMVLSNVNASDAMVIERIIEKDLKCGVSTSTVNKIWPKLIHEFPVMLASAFELEKVEGFEYPAVAQCKLDGMRANVVVRDGKVSVFSRNGKPIEMHGHFDNIFAGDDCVYDGELMVIGADGKFLDRKTGNGILNKAVKGTISAEEASKIHIVLYDIIDNISDWEAGKHKVHYLQRIIAVDKFVDFAKESGYSAYVSLVDGKLVSTPAEAFAYFNELYSQGQEGIILKATKNIWEDKRSKTIIKIKGELDCDMRVTGIEMGTGKYEGMLGAILCESEDGVIKTRVGTGFNDDQRKELLNDIVGKIVALNYNMRISNKQGGESLFLPVFVEVRLDKDNADVSKDIKVR